MKTATAYVRVSTEGQAIEGVSLEAQKEKIQAWCGLNGYTLANTFTDAGLSGSQMTNRPALQEALDACQSGSALVVYSLSRLARSTRDTIAIAASLEKKGVDLVSLSEHIDTTNAAGKMVFRMLAVLGEFERDQVSERTIAALQHKKSKGEFIGMVPYGYSLAADGVKLTPNDAEQVAIAAARSLKADGLTLRAIAARLGEHGHKPRGAKWHPQTVSNILKSESGSF